MNYYHKQLTGLGIGLGICFPLIGITLDLYLKNLAFSWIGIAQAHQLNPLHWIIDSAPLVLGTIFYFLGKYIVDRESALKEANNIIENKCADISEFVEALNQGNFDAEYSHYTEADGLSDILINFRDGLKQQREAAHTRAWTNEGLATFSKLIRTNTNDIPSLCLTLLSELIPHMQMNQGGIFVVKDDEDEPYLELAASYAWGKRRYVSKKIQLGETLVGQCWIERETIYLTEVPEDYITITSGLGKSLPRCILILPLKSDDEIAGVIELASFKQLEPFQIEFLEKVAESIASVLSALSTNAKVLDLLEQTQQQTLTMQAQEEEMRQNMEELQASQEELVRKEQGYLSTIQELQAQLAAAPPQ